MGSSAAIDVLVVDESQAFLAGTSRWIASRPDLRLVGTARSGPEALEAVERLRPDLVIVEAVLTGMDGFQLARTLKKRESAPLVLLVTFHASAAARAEAYAAGADGFLAKYDFSDEIEAILEEWRVVLPGRDGQPGRDGHAGRVEGVRTPETRARRGSRSEPDP